MRLQLRGFSQRTPVLGPHQQQRGLDLEQYLPIIGGIAILVYFLGGVFYQRNVAHARGWRQLPNYSMWAGIGNFIKVSWFTCVQRARQMVFPRITSVREGILPTMEVRPLMAPRKTHKSYMSRNSWTRLIFPKILSKHFLMSQNALARKRGKQKAQISTRENVHLVYHISPCLPFALDRLAAGFRIGSISAPHFGRQRNPINSSNTSF